MSEPRTLGPGLVHQAGVRITLRVVGGILLVTALVLLITGLLDFLSTMSPSSMDATPHKFWMFLVGIFLLAPAAWCLQAGFVGAAARFAAGEATPVIKSSADYLSDGKGILGVGVEQRTCAHCGAQNDADAKFCDSCGTALR